MALVDTAWYVNSVGYAAVTARVSGAAVTAGQIRRQFTTPAVGNERCFICIVAGTSAVATDATWGLTRGVKTIDGTVTWMECTGQAALNGDLANTQTWAAVKAATPAVLGQIIKRSNNASYQICTTAGAMSASEPAFSDTAGVTTTDTTAVWTSLGAVSGFASTRTPHARVTNACASTWCAANNTIFVGSNHAESQTGSMYLGSQISALTSVIKIICHNAAGPYPPTSSDLATTATISNTTNDNINLNGYSTYWYGITFRVGFGLTGSSAFLALGAQAGASQHYDACSFQLAINGGGAIVPGSFGMTIWNNCTVKFANIGQYIGPGTGPFLWQNTGPVLATGSLVPDNFLWLGFSSSTGAPTVVFEALDLSQINKGFVNVNGLYQVGSITVRDCKLHASMTVGSPTIPACSMVYQFSRSSS